MAGQNLRHEALFYLGEGSFLDRTLPFIRDGVAAGEPVMVAVSPEKIGLIESRLDAGSDAVTLPICTSSAGTRRS